MTDINYEGIKYLRDVGQNFYFGSKLGYARFPDDFMAAFDWYTDNYNKLDPDSDHFLAKFQNYAQVCFFSSTSSVDGIRSDNEMISESMYAADDSIIMPLGHFAFAEAYNDTNRMRLMVNLEEGGSDYGKIYVWNLAHNPLGEGDNTRGIGYVADSLKAFIENLQPEDAL